MTAVAWTPLIVGVVALVAYLLHRYVKHREFRAQEQGIAVGKAFGRLSEEELFAIICGYPMPEPRPPTLPLWQRMRRRMRGRP